MNKRMLAGVIFAAAFVATAAGAGPVFEFSSGGAYHVEGYGEWVLAVDGAGKMTIKHNTHGEIVTYGPYDLTAAEGASLRELVDAAELDAVDFPSRPGVPDEVSYRFEVHRKGEDIVLGVWKNDAREHDDLAALVNYSGTLIKQYTGVKPVLW